MRCITVALAAATVSLFIGATAQAQSCAVQAPKDLTNSGQLSFGTVTPPPSPGLRPMNVGGFEFDLSDALAKTMCLKPGYTVLAFAGLFPGLDAHKFDVAIASIGITTQREQSFSFVPYFLGGI